MKLAKNNLTKFEIYQNIKAFRGFTLVFISPRSQQFKTWPSEKLPSEANDCETLLKSRGALWTRIL